MTRFGLRLGALTLAVFATTGPPATAQQSPPSRAAATGDAIRIAVSSAQRPAADVERDVARHPEASMRFWGLKAGATVIDLNPGAGYWTQILGPYAKTTGGKYLGGGGAAGRAAFLQKHSDSARFGAVGYTEFGKGSPALAPAGSVDLILSARGVHNWMRSGFMDEAMGKIAAALKPGGVFVVEEHRADRSKLPHDGSTGYVYTEDVVAAAKRVGLTLDAASEINANPRDTKDHPFGVWTLPPTRRTSADGKSPPAAGFDAAKYEAIGESDRMMLRFRKR